MHLYIFNFLNIHFLRFLKFDVVQINSFISSTISYLCVDKVLKHKSECGSNLVSFEIGLFLFNSCVELLFWKYWKLTRKSRREVKIPYPTNNGDWTYAR